jgi:hypothetical protein
MTGGSDCRKQPAVQKQSFHTYALFGISASTFAEKQLLLRSSTKYSSNLFSKHSKLMECTFTESVTS